MAEGDNRPSGLLSKVAKFVRNPTKDWSELDQKEPDQDSGYSREALKEMIERKRQNDFVRKREFDHLRKLRRREPLAGTDSAGRPSFFQSSLTSNHEDRAETLKKIDEIEAQMSRQWWKGKQGEGEAPAGASFPQSSGLRPEAGPTQPPARSVLGKIAGAPSEAEDSHFEPTEASALQPSGQWTDSPPAEYIPTQLAEAAPTVPGAIEAPPPAMAAAPMPASAVPVARPGGAAAQGMPAMAPATPRAPVGAGFSTHRLYAAAPADNLTDPDLEESAIRFANGDDAGAEESLMAALQNDDLRPDVAETWMAALFDLYRATGQQARFDSVAIEFANRFGRSPPAWFSTPEMLKRSSAGAAPARQQRPAASAASEADWRSPAALSAAALAELQALAGVPGALVLDWSALTTIGLDAVAPLARMVGQWAVTPASLIFRGHGSLERALHGLTPSGDRTVDPMCWQLRMDALRIMRLQDAFELVALDYCVTYEVSPPSWQEPRSRCELQDMNDPQAREEEELRSSWDQPHSTWDDPLAGLTVPVGLEGQPPAVVELSGEILGDAGEVLARLEAGMEGANRMVISCARLIRVDFTAAGSILNWVAEQQGKGCQVQFRDVNRMVAAFFNVIGITEHARVVPRAG
jgi:anti-anti-sigma regulatory factor